MTYARMVEFVKTLEIVTVVFVPLDMKEATVKMK